LVAFFVVYCARPEDWIPGLHYIPLAKITGILAVVALFSSLGEVRRLPREVLYLLLLLVQFCLTIPFASVWRGGAFNHVLEFSKVVVIVPVVVLAVSTLARLRRLIFAQTACLLAVAIVSLATGRVVRDRLIGVLGGVYENPNDLALAIVLTMPFCFAFMLGARSGLRKASWLLAVAIMTYALLRTSSRGGLLAFVICMGLLLWEFGIRGRRHYLLPLAGLIALAGLLVAGRGVKSRFGAMFSDNANYSGDAASYASAVQRRELFWRSLALAARHPLFGVGPGNFQIVSGVWRVAHNSYTELAAEGGLPALIFFLLVFRRAFDNVRQTQLLVGEQTEQMLLARALRCGLVGFGVGALFASVEYHFFPYFLVAYTSALYAIAAKHTSQAQSSQGTTPKRRLNNRIRGEDRGLDVPGGPREECRVLASRR
jgi:O-antigen ligase